MSLIMYFCGIKCRDLKICLWFVAIVSVFLHTDNSANAKMPGIFSTQPSSAGVRYSGGNRDYITILNTEYSPVDQISLSFGAQQDLSISTGDIEDGIIKFFGKSFTVNSGNNKDILELTISFNISSEDEYKGEQNFEEYTKQVRRTVIAEILESNGKFDPNACGTRGECYPFLGSLNGTEFTPDISAKGAYEVSFEPNSRFYKAAHYDLVPGADSYSHSFKMKVRSGSIVQLGLYLNILSSNISNLDDPPPPQTINFQINSKVLIKAQPEKKETPQPNKKPGKKPGEEPPAPGEEPPAPGEEPAEEGCQGTYTGFFQLAQGAVPRDPDFQNYIMQQRTVDGLKTPVKIGETLSNESMFKLVKDRTTFVVGEVDDGMTELKLEINSNCAMVSVEAFMDIRQGKTYLKKKIPTFQTENLSASNWSCRRWSCYTAHYQNSS